MSNLKRWQKWIIILLIEAVFIGIVVLAAFTMGTTLGAVPTVVIAAVIYSFGYWWADGIEDGPIDENVLNIGK